jgi:hypothetical protein
MIGKTPSHCRITDKPGSDESKQGNGLGEVTQKSPVPILGHVKTLQQVLPDR